MRPVHGQPSEGEQVLLRQVLHSLYVFIFIFLPLAFSVVSFLEDEGCFFQKLSYLSPFSSLLLFVYQCVFVLSASLWVSVPMVTVPRHMGYAHNVDSMHRT